MYLSAVLRSALFENYDEDFKTLVNSLKVKLDGEVKELKGGGLSYAFFLSAQCVADEKKSAGSALIWQCVNRAQEGFLEESGE